MRKVLGATAGRLRRRLPPNLRQRVLRQARKFVGTTTVIVVVDERDLHRWPILTECLRANPTTEVVLAPVGEVALPDLTLANTTVKMSSPGTDWRGAATNAASLARGRFVLLHRACDELAPGSVATMVSAALASGSDAVLGGLDDPAGRLPWHSAQSWESTAVRATTLAQSPALVRHLGVGGTLWRRDRMPRNFGSDSRWQECASVAEALTRASRITRTSGIAATMSADHGWRAFGATPSELPGFASLHRRVDAILETLPGPAKQEWRSRVASQHLPRLLLDAERAGSVKWEELVSFVTSWTEPESIDADAAPARALLWAARNTDQAGVSALATEILREPELATQLLDGRIYADYESVGAPARQRELTAAESALELTVVRQSSTSIDVAVRIENLDLHGIELDVVQPRLARWVEDPLARGFDRPLAAAADGLLRLPADTRRVGVRVAEVSRFADLEAHPPPTPASSSVLRELSLDAAGLHLSGEGLAGARLLDPVDQEVGREEHGVLALTRTDFGIERPLPSGPHRLVGASGNLRCAEGLRERLPLVLESAEHRVTVRLGPRGGLVLGIQPPLPPEALGAYAQRKWRERYLLDDRPVDPRLVYLESYAGRQVTDSPAALGAGLLARRSDLDLVWGVADHSVRPPRGCRSVLIGSPQWWQVLGTAGLIVTNTDVEDWFRRRSNQFVVQTYHGHPAKAMGRSLWEAKCLRSGAVADARRRSAEAWSALLTPSAPMTQVFREQFDYSGLVIEEGFPRNDALLATDVESRRQQARERLGIGDRTAVLYAPTWREHLATRHRAAASANLLDVDQLTSQLAPHSSAPDDEEFVLLLRGHRFHAAEGSSGRTIDVTDYPEIDDLVLASDAAILDYSSLRFDYALTGKPMVFLVPDLADYQTRLRGFLVPFADSAPGPWVNTTAEVAEQLRRLDDLRADYAEAIAAFNARWNALADGQVTRRVLDRIEELALPPRP